MYLLHYDADWKTIKSEKMSAKKRLQKERKIGNGGNGVTSLSIPLKSKQHSPWSEITFMCLSTIWF